MTPPDVPAAARRTWLITGASSGFGDAIARAAAARGDVVVATARRPERLRELEAAWPGQVVPMALDVNDRDRGREVVDQVASRFGGVDVLVNNAGFTQVGAVEETTEDELRAIMDTHFFAPVALVRAVLPHMRVRGGGAIVQMSSVGGQLSYAGFGAYSATKCALEGLSEALAVEAAPFGIRVLIVEPGAFRTGLFEGGAAYMSTPMPEYADTVGPTRAFVEGNDGLQPGDPAKAAAAILAALDAERTPLRLPLGDDAVDSLRAHADGIRSELEDWEAVSRATGFDPAP
jgi:NAD(P)-dependent dehydrogenase (short-subunit alcohol dehydrogenase family)